MPDNSRRLASERIRILFTLAEREDREHSERAQRYTALARRIASRNRIHLSPEFKHRVCPGCKSYLSPSKSRTRIRQEREPHITVTCLQCGHITRIPFRRRKP